MKIVAAADLGELGPTEGRPVIYHWSLLNSATVLVPWAVALGFLLLPANRNRRAAAVVLPFAATSFILYLLGKLPLPSNSGFEEYFLALQVLAASLCAFWLLSGLVAGRNRLVVFAEAIAFVALITGAAYCYMENLELNGPVRMLLVVSMIQAVAALSAVALGGVRCRKKFGARRFTLWSSLWLFVINLGLMSTFVTILLLVSPAPPAGRPFAYLVLIVPALYAAVLTLAGLLVLLPLLILTFNNGFYRERFHAIFRLPGMAEQSEADKFPIVR